MTAEVDKAGYDPGLSVSTYVLGEDRSRPSQIGKEAGPELLLPKKTVLTASDPKNGAELLLPPMSRSANLPPFTNEHKQWHKTNQQH